MVDSLRLGTRAEFDDSESSLGEDETGSDLQDGNIGQGEPNPIEEVKAIANLENRILAFWKVIVVISILLTGAAVSVKVFWFLDNKQEIEFENQFQLHANSIRDLTQLHYRVTKDSMTDLATEVTAYAIKSNLEWPFVTMPLFEVNAHHARRMAGMETIGLCPIVKRDQRQAWEAYSLMNYGWIEESRGLILDKTANNTLYQEANIMPIVYKLSNTSDPAAFPMPVNPNNAEFMPVWQFSPPPFHGFLTNMDILSIPQFEKEFLAVYYKKDATFSRVDPQFALLADTGVSRKEHQDFHSHYVHLTNESNTFAHPHAAIVVPVFRELNNAIESDIVASIGGVLPFDHFLADLAPDDADGIHVVLANTCDQVFTYELAGKKARYLGPEDLHDPDFDYLEVIVPIYDEKDFAYKDDPRYCLYEFRIYPSIEFKESIEDTTPFFLCTISAVVFFAIAVGFFVYDRFVHKRNTKIVDAAARSNAIILSLFPAKVRDQLLAQQKWDTCTKQNAASSQEQFTPESLFNDSSNLNTAHNPNSAPIADLFPDCTVLFADIAGFTAWSSVREPAQVFVLLENLFSSFDRIAKTRKVFKVETIGDCYVAAAGLPNHRHDHAVVMCRFARDCLHCMNTVVRRLETVLGPDTSELALRVGMHSGPVTAGVLRGERARFQLFGDTVNTAARMESTGIGRRIQVSQDTADSLISHGKGSWVTKREDIVEAKGKGLMQTYWLSIGTAKKSSTTDETTETPVSNDLQSREIVRNLTSKKISSLIKWNVAMLSRILQQLIASRRGKGIEANPGVLFSPDGKHPLDEVVEVIALPKGNRIFDSKKEVKLTVEIKQQLESFVSDIAAMYKENLFHNFEHACHVTMSVVKLLSRIVAPPKSISEFGSDSRDSTDSEHEDHSYGITSDPLAQFACVFSALIHDADHPGVPNAQLVKEGTALSEYYNGRSVAEQNSVDLAWELFMRDDYDKLRRVVCATPGELQRFRQLVVNCVMATDVMDKELKVLRNARWEKAFDENDLAAKQEPASLAKDRKATIVIEHLIQASDVAHTMQHWHVYRKWNERLFQEMVKAYEDGRAVKHPADFWYKGELGFFDFCIIPLAKKLKECGVFGVSSDEYLNYAEKNRQEWAMRGKEVVAAMMEAKAASNVLSNNLQPQPPQQN